MGFTASTGRAWAKHDVLAWYWCHNDGGGPEKEGASESTKSGWKLNTPQLVFEFVTCFGG